MTALPISHWICRVIVLDTNVISEIMRPQPNEGVLSWLNDQDSSRLYITVITLAEIGYGLKILPEGRRKQILKNQFELFIAQGFSYRLLSFNQTSAETYAEIMAQRKLKGRPMSILDGQIAAITRVQNYALATRNTKDFECCDIELFNPFLSH